MMLMMTAYFGQLYVDLQLCVDYSHHRPMAAALEDLAPGTPKQSSDELPAEVLQAVHVLVEPILVSAVCTLQDCSLAA